MLSWLAKLDQTVFSPPHRFETILAYTWAQLVEDSEPTAEPGDAGSQNAPETHRPKSPIEAERR